MQLYYKTDRCTIEGINRGNVHSDPNFITFINQTAISGKYDLKDIHDEYNEHPFTNQKRLNDYIMRLKPNETIYVNKDSVETKLDSFLYITKKGFSDVGSYKVNMLSLVGGTLVVNPDIIKFGELLTSLYDKYTDDKLSLQDKRGMVGSEISIGTSTSSGSVYINSKKMNISAEIGYDHHSWYDGNNSIELYIDHTTYTITLEELIHLKDFILKQISELEHILTVLSTLHKAIYLIRRDFDETYIGSLNECGGFYEMDEGRAKERYPDSFSRHYYTTVRVASTDDPKSVLNAEPIKALSFLLERMVDYSKLFTKYHNGEYTEAYIGEMEIDDIEDYVSILTDFYRTVNNNAFKYSIMYVQVDKSKLNELLAR